MCWFLNKLLRVLMISLLWFCVFMYWNFSNIFKSISDYFVNSLVIRSQAKSKPLATPRLTQVQCRILAIYFYFYLDWYSCNEDTGRLFILFFMNISTAKGNLSVESYSKQQRLILTLIEFCCNLRGCLTCFVIYLTPWEIFYIELN